MTTVFPQTIRCFMCGSENEFGVIGSTNSFGPTDLDTRPPEMKRSTMSYWVQTCPVCGYSAVDLSDDTPVGREFLETDAYKTCDGIEFVSDLAKEFYRHYLIMAAEGKEEDAFWALLHAAWASDDKEDETGAVLSREKAIIIAYKLLDAGVPEWKDTLSLILADMLRRVSCFDELLKRYDAVRFNGELQNQIIDFEKELARRKITKCLTAKDAVDYAEGTFVWENV